MIGLVQPRSFAEEWMEGWSLWVLDHGLPDLPATVEVGESVPVARWAGPRFGAVLHVDWSWSEDHEDDSLSSEIEVFRRGADGWESSSGSGGGGWFDPPLCRPDVPPRYAALGHWHASGGDGWGCCAAYGLAGVEAVTVEVIDMDGVTRHPIESPLGVFVVCADRFVEATVRVLDAAESPLSEQGFSPESGWRS
jgi:hypothetical protein